jgi:hypothetical protein
MLGRRNDGVELSATDSHDLDRFDVPATALITSTVQMAKLFGA